MSRSERTHPRGVAVIVGAMIGALALAGCGAGQITQTSDQVTGVGGADAGTATILVRNAQIEFGDEVEGGTVYPRGAAAPLQMRIINEGTDGDRLVSVTSSAASSVQVSGETEVPGGQVLLVEGEPVPVATRPPAVLPTPMAGASGEREAQIVLTGLREDVRAGLTYEVVLVFDRAGEIRVDVPVGNPQEPREPAAE